jgi:hypothetical protein
MFCIQTPWPITRKPWASSRKNTISPPRSSWKSLSLGKWETRPIILTGTPLPTSLIGGVRPSPRYDQQSSDTKIRPGYRKVRCLIPYRFFFKYSKTLWACSGDSLSERPPSHHRLVNPGNRHFATESRNILSIDKYRFHYMDHKGQMLFRYDNAPHHSETGSHPHHKHTPDKIAPTIMPSLKDILNEVSAIIIERHP